MRVPSANQASVVGENVGLAWIQGTLSKTPGGELTIETEGGRKVSIEIAPGSIASTEATQLAPGRYRGTRIGGQLTETDIGRAIIATQLEPGIAEKPPLTRSKADVDRARSIYG